MILLGLLAGCSSYSMTMTRHQAFSQVEVQSKTQALNEQILSLGARLTARASQDYQVGPEDLLEVMVYGEQDLGRAVRVNGQGQINMPLVGTVKVAGMTPREVEAKLVDMYGERFLKDPQVSVFVKEYRHSRVALTGAMKTPGFYELIGPRSLMEMLAMAGGLDDRAGDKVHIIRPKAPPRDTKGLQLAAASQSFEVNTETIVIDMRQVLKDRTGKLNVTIQQGDVINVPFAGNAFVFGAVNKAGNVPVKKDLTVTQAVAMAGGLNTMLADPGGTTILRMGEEGQAISLSANLGRIIKKQEPDIPLKENDVVFVPESVVRRFLMDVRTLVGGGMSVGYSMVP
jgi:polysaccharide export outer membrane protein